MKHDADAAQGHGAFSIPSLDGLRAVSFLMVFLGHVGVPGVPGGFGVTVFFFLSGYLITTLLRLEVNKSGSVNFKLFYLRRALRIWPPFYIVLAAASALTAAGFLKGRLAAIDVLAQLLHYSNYWLIWHGGDFIAPGTGVYWSLAVEEHFYLILPALYLLLRKLELSPRSQATVFLSMCAVTLAWRTVLILFLHSSSDRTYLATDTRFDSMLFGCYLAVFNNPAMDLPKRERPSPVELLLLAGGVCLLFSSFVIRDPAFRETLRYTLQGIGLIPVFVTAVRYPQWGPYPFLQLRFVRYVGTISFTLYLVHQAVIVALNDHGLQYRPVLLPIALAASLGIASAMWFVVEKPCAGLRRRFASLGPRAASAQASAGGIEATPIRAPADIGPS